MAPSITLPSSTARWAGRAEASDLTPWPPSLRGKGENSGEGRGRVNPPRVGPRTLANPQPTGVGNGGGGGAAPSQGVWGMCPQNKKRGGELPTLATPPRVGPKTLANPQPTGVGQGGGPRGLWGVSPPQIPKKGRAANPCNPATSGTQNPGEPSANGGGQWGWRGPQPPPRGFGGCAHKIKKEGASCPH